MNLLGMVRLDNKIKFRGRHQGWHFYLVETIKGVAIKGGLKLADPTLLPS